MCVFFFFGLHSKDLKNISYWNIGIASECSLPLVSDSLIFTVIWEEMWGLDRTRAVREVSAEHSWHWMGLVNVWWIFPGMYTYNVDLKARMQEWWYLPFRRNVLTGVCNDLMVHFSRRWMGWCCGNVCLLGKWCPWLWTCRWVSLCATQVLPLTSHSWIVIFRGANNVWTLIAFWILKSY